MLYNKKHQCISTTASGLHVFTCKDQWHPPSRSKRSTIFLDAFSELPRSNKLRSIEGKGGKVENETKNTRLRKALVIRGAQFFLWRNIAHGVSTLSELPKHSWRKHPWTVGGNSPEQARSDGYSPEPPAEAASSSHRIYWWIVLRPKRFRFRGNNLLCIPTSWQKCIPQTLRVKSKLPERQPKKLPCRWAGNRASCRLQVNLSKLAPIPQGCCPKTFLRRTEIGHHEGSWGATWLEIPCRPSSSMSQKAGWCPASCLWPWVVSR